MSFLDRLKFRDILAGTYVVGTLLAFVYAPLDDIVKGALIASNTLIVQFYFRRAQPQ